MNEKDLEFERALEERKEESVEQLDVNNKMKTSFLNYAMSVIIARALPDARDGLQSSCARSQQKRILTRRPSCRRFAAELLWTVCMWSRPTVQR